jgi:fatty acid desaturase
MVEHAVLEADDRRSDRDSRQDRLPYAALTALIIAVGLLVRSPALGLPWLVAKYAGAMLWGAMVCAGVRTIQPRASQSASLAAAAVLAATVEASRLFHQPDLDAFRATLAGRLSLGRIFSLWNVVAYLVGIVALVLAETYRSDAWMRPLRRL